MKKILIIGISGVGKTYIANKISKKLSIPIYHYDSICWKENWVEEDENTVRKRILMIINKESWVFEGYITPAGSERLKATDIVIYLDFTGISSVLGGLERWWKFRDISRPELAKGCTDTLDLKYLKTMYTRAERQEIEDQIIGYEDKVLRFKNRSQINKWIEKL